MKTRKNLIINAIRINYGTFNENVSVTPKILIFFMYWFNTLIHGFFSVLLPIKLSLFYPSKERIEKLIAKE